MLSKEITDLLSVEYKGLFEDQHHCMALLTQKRDSGDADTPPELMQGPLFDLSPDLFIWVTQKHLENRSSHLIAKDVMSNICTAGLSGSYGTIVEMLATAGQEDRAAQIWRADVASHVDVFREFLKAHKAVEKYNKLSEEKRKKSPPDRFQIAMAKDFPMKKQAAFDAVIAFETWLARYGISERPTAQIVLWKEELNSEAKPKLPPAEKTPMSEELFWAIIANAQSTSEIETALRLEDELVTYTAKAIRDAGKIMQSRLAETYRNDIWALAYLLQDGCSDDAFEDFRSWLVLKGRDVFDLAMNETDKFAPQLVEGASFAAAGRLQSAFENAYLRRSGKPLILPRVKYRNLRIDEDSFADLLPNLATRLLSA